VEVCVPRLVTLSRVPPRLLFQQPRRYPEFLDRLALLTERWGTDLLAYTLEPRRARLLLSGARTDVAHVARLQQSGWGVWSHHRGDFVQWAPATFERVRSTETARARAWLQGGFPPCWPWTSLWDLLQLRHSRWIVPARQAEARLDPAWITPLAARPLAPPPGWRSERLDWAVLEAVVLQITARPPEHRYSRVLRTQLAWVAGWSPGEIAEQLGVGVRAVARCLRKEPAPGWSEGRLVLASPELRPDGLPSPTGRAMPGPLEVRCPATASSSPAPAK